MDTVYFGSMSKLSLLDQKIEIKSQRDIKSGIFFELMVGSMINYPPSLPPIFPIGCVPCGLLSYRDGEQEAQCMLSSPVTLTVGAFPSPLVSSSDSWTFPAIVA